jgi:dTDP-4-amino-4,6-dideoxygalactose transaminase
MPQTATRKPAAFDKPIYVARPVLPPLAEYMEHLEDIWESCQLTNGGAKHRKLETELARHLGTEHLSLFNNGTIALVVACQALRLSGEVITTPFTFPATPHVLSWNGITPVFADIDPETMNLDPNKIEALITNRTTAILAVHVYGTPCDVEAIQRIADTHGLRVIYDGAHAFGTEIGGKPIVDYGDATMLSFHATKLFHTAEGGAMVVRDRETKNRIDLLKNFGIQNEFEVRMPGINGKMSELQAAMGLSVLGLIDQERNHRQKIWNVYFSKLGDIPGLVLPTMPGVSKNSMQYFSIRLDEKCNIRRDDLYEELKQYNIYTRKYFYPLCSDYSCYRMLPSSDPHHLPVANRLAGQVLCLPFHSGIDSDDAERICDTISYVVGR